MGQLVLPQVGGPLELLAALLAIEGQFLLRFFLHLLLLLRLVGGIAILLFRRLLPRLVPPAMGGQVSRTIELLAALGTPVLQQDDAGAPVPGQAEGVLELDLAQSADIVPDHVLDGGQFRLGLLRDLDYVVLGVNVAVAVLHRSIGDVLERSDDGARDGGTGLLIELQLAGGFIAGGLSRGSGGLVGFRRRFCHFDGFRWCGFYCFHRNLLLLLAIFAGCSTS